MPEASAPAPQATPTPATAPDTAAQALLEASPAPAAPASDTAPEGSPAAPKKDDKPALSDSSRFAALTRKERAILKQKAELEAREKSLESQYKPWQEVAELAKTSKFETLKRLGFREEDIRALGIGPDDVDPVAAAERRAEEVVQKRLKAEEDRQRSAQVEQYESAKRTMLQQAEKVAESSPGLELLKANKSYPAVVQLVEDHYHAHGEILSVAEASKRIETQIEAQVTQLIDSSPRLQKALAKRFQPAPEPKQQPGQPAPKPAPPSKPPPSLTHQAATAPPSPQAKLTSAQRLERAKRIAMGLPV